MKHSPWIGRSGGWELPGEGLYGKDTAENERHLIARVAFVDCYVQWQPVQELMTQWRKRAERFVSNPSAAAGEKLGETVGSEAADFVHKYGPNLWWLPGELSLYFFGELFRSNLEKSEIVFLLWQESPLREDIELHFAARKGESIDSALGRLESETEAARQRLLESAAPRGRMPGPNQEDAIALRARLYFRNVCEKTSKADLAREIHDVKAAEGAHHQAFGRECGCYADVGRSIQSAKQLLSLSSVS